MRPALPPCAGFERLLRSASVTPRERGPVSWARLVPFPREGSSSRASPVDFCNQNSLHARPRDRSQSPVDDSMRLARLALGWRGPPGGVWPHPPHRSSRSRRASSPGSGWYLRRRTLHEPHGPSLELTADTSRASANQGPRGEPPGASGGVRAVIWSPLAHQSFAPTRFARTPPVATSSRRRSEDRSRASSGWPKPADDSSDLAAGAWHGRA